MRLEEIKSIQIVKEHSIPHPGKLKQIKINFFDRAENFPVETAQAASIETSIIEKNQLPSPGSIRKVHQKTYVFILLGKFLRDRTSLTVEGKARVTALVKELQFFDRSMDRIVIVFTGYRGEAQELLREFQRQTVDLKLPSYEVKLETEAKNTQENILNSCKWLQDARIQPDCIYLVSSKYHLERLQRAQELVPEKAEFSIFESFFRDPTLPVIPIYALYPILEFDREDRKQTAEFYMRGHLLTILSTMLYGLADGNILEVRPKVVDWTINRYEDWLMLATGLDPVRNPHHLTILDVMNRNKANLERIMRTVRHLSGKPAQTAREYCWTYLRQDLKSFAQHVNLTLSEIRLVADPDR